MRKSILTLVVCIVVILASQSQTKIDSLQVALDKGTNVEKIQTYEKIIREYLRTDPGKAIDFCNLMISFSDSISNLKGKASGYQWLGEAQIRLTQHNESLESRKTSLALRKEIGEPKDIAYTLIAIGGIYMEISELDSSLACYDEALEILEKLNDMHGCGVAYINKAMVYEKMGINPNALENVYNALANYEQLNDSLGMASCYGQIATVQTKMKEFDKAIENFNKAISIYKARNEFYHLSNELGNVGVAYNSIEENEKAMDSYKQSLAIRARYRDQYGVAIMSMNIGELFIEMARPDSALHYLSESKALLEGLNMPHPLCYNLNALGMYFEEVGNFQQSIDYRLQAYNLAVQISSKDFQNTASLALSRLYEKTGDYKKAFSFFKEHKALSDSLINEGNIKKLVRLEDKYKFEKEQQKIEILHQAELSERETVLYVIFAALVLVMLSMLFLIVQYRQKNRAYSVLVKKNIELMKAAKPRNTTGLKNGELFEIMEQRMKSDILYRNPDISLESLSILLKTNRTYISQAVADHARNDFRTYINEYRIRDAMQMLADPDIAQKYTIMGIAADVGFKSISAFNKAFKQVAGVTPSFFRDKAQ